MNARAAPSWRQLAPLVVVVVVAHGWLLQMQGRELVQPAAEAVRSFATRTIAPVVPTEPVATPVVREEAGAVPRPARRPRIPQEQEPAARPRMPEPAPEALAPAPPMAATEAAPAAPEPAAPEPAAPDSAASQARLIAIPAPARLRYELVAEIRGFTVHGNADLDWRHDGANYEAKLALHGNLFPRREQRSSGRITAEGLAPQVFHDKGRSEQAAHFDRENGRVIFSNNRPDAVLAAGAQDRLSVVLQLAALIAGQPAQYRPGAQIAVPTASTRDAETWYFDVVAEEDLQLPGGAVQALKLQRKPRKEFDQKIELWLAPRMDYAPVRLRLTNPNGDTVDQRWSSTDRG